MGKYWSRRGATFHKAYSGPRVRRRETSRIVAEVHRCAGISFPEIEVVTEFDEYQAQAVMRACLPQLLRVDTRIGELSRAYDGLSEPSDRRRAFRRLFEAVVSKWVAGETTADDIESWHEFCLRVERGLLNVLRDTTPAASAVIFTSAGSIGAAVRRALHLSAEDTLRLSWMPYNSSFSNFRVSGERFTLSAFNAHPHLDEDSLLTYW